MEPVTMVLNGIAMCDPTELPDTFVSCRKQGCSSYADNRIDSAD